MLFYYHYMRILVIAPPHAVLVSCVFCGAYPGVSDEAGWTAPVDKVEPAQEHLAAQISTGSWQNAHHWLCPSARAGLGFDS